jgi:hypothetical protein
MNVQSLNEQRLNLAAHKWLREAREHAPPHYLHLLSLAAWGLENGAEGEWPSRDRPALEEQLGLLFGWKPENALAWLLSNPNGPDDPEEQEQDLLRQPEGGSGERTQRDLQPAASGQSGAPTGGEPIALKETEEAA